MPTLEEVLQTFPDRRFLINVKSRDPAEGKMLADFLGHFTPERRRQLMVYGGTEPVDEVARHLREIRTTSLPALKACMLPYIGYGWTGLVPGACRNALVLVPVNVAPWLWGWPDLLLARMRSVDAEVFVLGPYHGGGFSTGIDTAEDLARLPPGWSGGVWTNEIEPMARALKKASAGAEPPAPY